MPPPFSRLLVHSFCKHWLEARSVAARAGCWVNQAAWSLHCSDVYSLGGWASCEHARKQTQGRLSTLQERCCVLVRPLREEPGVLWSAPCGGLSGLKDKSHCPHAGAGARDPQLRELRAGEGRDQVTPGLVQDQGRLPRAREGS